MLIVIYTGTCMLTMQRYTRRLAIANGTCVSFCNQPKAQFSYPRRVTPIRRCLHRFCGWRHLATSRESKAHFGLPWVRPCDNRSKCYMDGKRIQCWSNASQHIPIYLQPFTSYRKILVGNIFIPHLCLAAPQISRRSCIGYTQN